MSKSWSILKITLLVLLSVLFLLVLILSLTVGVFDGKVLKADFYKEELQEAHFYERVYDDVMPEIKDLPSYYGGLVITKQEADELIRKIIPPQWLQEQVETAIDSAIPWLRSDTDELNVIIDLLPAKQRARTEVIGFARQKLFSLPEGVLPDLSRLTQGEFPLSLPGKPGSAERQAIIEPYMPQLTNLINDNINSAPDTLDLIDEAAQEDNKTKEEFLEDFDDSRNVIDTITAIGLPLSYLALAVLLVCIALLNWGKLRAALRWVGGTMLFCALPLMVMGLVARYAGPGIAEDRLSDGLEDVPASIINLSSDLAGSAIKELSWAFVVPAIIITAIGLVVFVASLIVRRETSHQE